MLTSIGRAAARRVVSAKLTLATPTPALVARPIAVRSLTTSKWSLLAAKATATKPAKAGTKTKATTKKSDSRGRPVKGAVKAKKPAKKAAPKKKKKKVVVKKKVVKKPVKKVLTEEQKLKKKVRELRKTAMLRDEPAYRKPSAYNIYVREAMAGEKGAKLADVAHEFKNISASRKEELTRQSDREDVEVKQKHKDWQAGIPIEDIYMANLARAQLRRMKLKTATNLQDARMPRRPSSAYNVYVTRETEGSTGGFNPQVASGWKSLSQSEKDAYAPNYSREMEEFTKQLDVVRQMAKLKIRQSKEVTPKVAAKV